MVRMILLNPCFKVGAMKNIENRCLLKQVMGRFLNWTLGQWDNWLETFFSVCFCTHSLYTLFYKLAVIIEVVLIKEGCTQREESTRFCSEGLKKMVEFSLRLIYYTQLLEGNKPEIFLTCIFIVDFLPVFFLINPSDLSHSITLSPIKNIYNVNIINF